MELYYIYSHYKIHLKYTEDLKSMCCFMKFTLFAYLLFQEYKINNSCFIYRNSFGYRQMVLPLGKVSLIVPSHCRKRMCRNQEHENSDVGWVEEKSTNNVDSELFLVKARWSRWLWLAIVILESSGRRPWIRKKVLSRNWRKSVKNTLLLLLLSHFSRVWLCVTP